jgi:NADPH:quinone reductase-like Zn-dependent oxidoreductase
MNRAVERHGLRPVIDRRFGFDEVVEACRYVESGAHVGKVVLDAD